jgi:hypothetical protein
VARQSGGRRHHRMPLSNLTGAGTCSFADQKKYTYLPPRQLAPAKLGSTAGGQTLGGPNWPAQKGGGVNYHHGSEPNRTEPKIGGHEGCYPPNENTQPFVGEFPIEKMKI